MTTKIEVQIQLIDRWLVIKMLGISESTLERMMLCDTKFPMPRRIGSRSIRWLKHEVEEYIYGLKRVDYFG
jgi:predicted DNA-binding transcriptional regulator AlpA